MDWHVYYPAFVVPQAQSTKESALTDVAPHRTISLSKEVTVADIGCGFGGLLVALAPKLPDELLLGAYPYPTCKKARLQEHRYGNPNQSHRIRSGPHQSIAESKSWHKSLPEYRLSPGQLYEIPPQLLQKRSALQNLPLLPRSAFQS